MNGESASKVEGEGENVFSLSSEMKGFVGGLTSAGDVRILLAWQEMLCRGVHSFIKESVPLVRASRAGRITALITVLNSLLLVLDNYRGKLEELESLLSLNERSEVRRALPDGPQPGDVRVVFGEAQVFVDGGWFALGAECKP